MNDWRPTEMSAPLMNRWSTAGFVPPPVYIGFPLFVLATSRSEQLFTLPWRLEGRVAFGPTEMSAPCSVQLRPAPPSAVRLRMRAHKTHHTCRVQNPNTQRAGRVGTAHSGRRGEKSRAEQSADVSVGPKGNRLSSPLGHRKQLF